MHQGGRFYRLSTERAAHYENIKPHNASSEDWCIPADMQEGDYLIVDPACEVNEKGTRDKNDGNEVVDDCDLPLDLELTETLPYAKEDWDCPEQTEIDKGIQPDFPLTMETRQNRKGRSKKKYRLFMEQMPGVGGMRALPPVASQIPGKYLSFLVTKATDRQHVDPESLVLALTRLRDFLVERGVTSLSLLVYDHNRGKLHPRELYALVYVIFSETDIEVYLQKKYYLSIC